MLARMGMRLAYTAALLVIVMSLAGCGAAPSPATGRLDALVAFLRDAHPDPHRYVDATALDAPPPAPQWEAPPAPRAP